MVFFPNSKINLGLEIISKRPDNFHNLISCFYPVPLCDVLEIIAAEEFSFTTSGLEIPGITEQNLCIQAYHLLCRDFSLPTVNIHLHKAIPMGAGLGGGSSDAAFVLKGLNALFELGLSETILTIYAQKLGSDCAFFIKNSAALATEKGDILTPLAFSLKGYSILIVHPNIHSSTQEAYAGVKPKPSTIDLTEVLNGPKEHWEKMLKNTFEDSLFPKYPELESIKMKLYETGAFYASMTGSGSAIFGLFENLPQIPPHLFKGYFLWSGLLD